MRNILLAFFLLYIANTYAITLDELHGCYTTISVDDERPTSGPIEWRNQSALEAMSSDAYRTTDTLEYIDISVLSLYTGFSNGYYGYNPLVILRDQGFLTETENALHYEVDMDIFLRYGNKSDHYLKLEITKNDTDNETIQGHAVFISKSRNIDREVNFKLKKADCISKE